MPGCVSRRRFRQGPARRHRISHPGTAILGRRVHSARLGSRSSRLAPEELARILGGCPPPFPVRVSFDYGYPACFCKSIILNTLGVVPLAKANSLVAPPLY